MNNKTVNVDFVARAIEIDLNGKEHFIAAALAAEQAIKAKEGAELVAPEYDKAKNVLDNIVTYTDTAKAQADIATTKAAEAVVSADIATQKAAEAGAKAEESANSANASKVSAEEANASTSLAIQALRDATLINNSGNADKLSTTNAADIIELRGDVGKCFDFVKGNIFDTCELLSQNAYVNLAKGKLVLSAEDSYSSYLLPIRKNTNYAFTKIRFALLVDEDKSTALSDLLRDTPIINSGNASYIAFSFNHDRYSVNDYIVSEGTSLASDKIVWTELSGIPNLINNSGNAKIPFEKKSGITEYSKPLSIPNAKTNLRKGERIVVDAVLSRQFETNDYIRIGWRYSASESTIINNFIVEDSVIKYCVADTQKVFVNHNLTLKDNIQIIMEYKDNGKMSVSVISAGELFREEFEFTRATIGYPFIYSGGVILNNLSMSWTCKDIKKDIWMFGDSYFAYSKQRWTYYLNEYDYIKNVLLDGFPGEGSVNGRSAFTNLLRYGTPKYAIWCLGMNDGSDSDTEASAVWVQNRDLFLSLCDAEHIEPIFATIPTVPSINHEKKNEWVRNSGYRYIDFSKAVGASSSGVWYDGMLSADKVHPTEKGAKALFGRVLLDVPEIMLD